METKSITCQYQQNKIGRILGAGTQSISLYGLTTGTSETYAIQQKTQSVSCHDICATNTKRLLEFESGRINYEIHTDTCMVGKGFRIINTYDNNCKVGGFKDRIGLILLDFVDVVAVASNGYDNEVILRINKDVSKPIE